MFAWFLARRFEWTKLFPIDLKIQHHNGIAAEL